MKAVWLFTILFLACGTAQSQGLRVLPVQIHGDQGFPAAIQFYCTQKYSRKHCQNDIFILRQKLGNYPLEKLGSWSFVVASTEEWDTLLKRLNLPNTPVFSALGGHMTVISQILFSGPVDRRNEMMMLYKVPLDQLLDLAIAHELGHAFCRESDETKARVFGEQLRTGHAPGCRPRQTLSGDAGKRDLIRTRSAANSLDLVVHEAKVTNVPNPRPKPENGTR